MRYFSLALIVLISFSIFQISSAAYAQEETKTLKILPGSSSFERVLTDPSKFNTENMKPYKYAKTCENQAMASYQDVHGHIRHFLDKGDEGALVKLYDRVSCMNIGALNRLSLDLVQYGPLASDKAVVFERALVTQTRYQRLGTLSILILDYAGRFLSDEARDTLQSTALATFKPTGPAYIARANYIEAVEAEFVAAYFSDLAKFDRTVQKCSFASIKDALSQAEDDKSDRETHETQSDYCSTSGGGSQNGGAGGASSDAGAQSVNFSNCITQALDVMRAETPACIVDIGSNLDRLPRIPDQSKGLKGTNFCENIGGVAQGRNNPERDRQRRAIAACHKREGVVDDDELRADFSEQLGELNDEYIEIAEQVTQTTVAEFDARQELNAAEETEEKLRKDKADGDNSISAKDIELAAAETTLKQAEWKGAKAALETARAKGKVNETKREALARRYASDLLKNRIAKETCKEENEDLSQFIKPRSGTNICDVESQQCQDECRPLDAEQSVAAFDPNKGQCYYSKAASERRGPITSDWRKPGGDRDPDEGPLSTPGAEAMARCLAGKAGIPGDTPKFKTGLQRICEKVQCANDQTATLDGFGGCGCGTLPNLPAAILERDVLSCEAIISCDGADKCTCPSLSGTKQPGPVFPSMGKPDLIFVPAFQIGNTVQLTPISDWKQSIDPNVKNDIKRP